VEGIVQRVEIARTGIVVPAGWNASYRLVVRDAVLSTTDSPNEREAAEIATNVLRVFSPFGFTVAFGTHLYELARRFEEQYSGTTLFRVRPTSGVTGHVGRGCCSGTVCLRRCSRTR